MSMRKSGSLQKDSDEEKQPELSAVYKVYQCDNCEGCLFRELCTKS